MEDAIKNLDSFIVKFYRYLKNVFNFLFWADLCKDKLLVLMNVDCWLKCSP